LHLLDAARQELDARLAGMETDLRSLAETV